MQSYKMWIDGNWVTAASGKTFKVYNPATEEEIAEVPLGAEVEVNQAVAAAKKAYPAWSRKTQEERSAILIQIAQGIRDNLDEFARVETLDHGFPIHFKGTSMLSMATLEYIAQVARSVMAGDHLPLRPNMISCIKREPVGVCALIVPWNMPLSGAVAMMAACIATGNTCVIKPASADCLSALQLCEILEELDMPEGTVNVITGPGGSTGKALATHPDVRHVSFTGGTETGKDIMSYCAASVKHSTLELGGKNPFIVCEDADLDAAVDAAVFGSFFNSGQVCASPSRYYVAEKVHDAFVEKFVTAARQVVVGDPFDEKTQVGPVVTAEHRDVVEGYITAGLKAGARAVLGGQRPTEPPLDRGYFVMPTIFTGVTQDMSIAQEEIFGPVASVIKFKDEAEAIRMANDSTYGLAASVWTADVARGLRYCDQIEAGTVWVNEHMIRLLELPWGGYKESGIGKTASVYGVEEYTQMKVIHADLSGEAQKPWHRL